MGDAQIFYPPLAFLDFWGLYFFQKFYPIHAQIFYPIHAQNFLKILSYTCGHILSPTCLSRFWVSLFFSKFLSHTCANILSHTCAKFFENFILYMRKYFIPHLPF